MGATAMDDKSTSMRAARHALDDEAFLDAALDVALERIQAGHPLDLDSLCCERPHLNQEITDVARLAREIAVQHPPVVPDIAGHDVLQELGSGAMGTVYLARQRKLDRLVALKVLPPASAMASRARRRFRAEAQALARLRDPHIVPVYEVIEEGELFAYSMEWVDGCTVADCIAHLQRIEGPPTRAEIGRLLRSEEQLQGDYVEYVCHLGVAIARALEMVHRSGFLHRDVKPSNILLRRDGTPLLSDFGLVRGETSTLETQAGHFVGTPAYSSPEQLRGEGDDLDGRCDVYSLGVTLYQALSLKLPYGTLSTTEILRRVEEGQLEPLGGVAPGVSRDLETIVHVAMAAEPARRYQSAGELADDLERYLTGYPILARPASGAYRLGKFITRHPAATAALMVFVLSVSIFGVSTAVQAAELRRRQVGLQRFSDLGLHGRLVELEGALWPAAPERLPQFESWLSAARDLIGRADLHRGDAASSTMNGQAAENDTELASDPLDLLVARLAEFTAPGDGLFDQVEARYDFARTIHGRSIGSAEAAQRWREAIRSIADREQCPLYKGLEIPPQLGLLPLGRDETSGLWEFAHLQTGEASERNTVNGRLKMRQLTGLVFVLLPGARFQLGAQAESDDEPRYDRSALNNEVPVHDIALAPFFLSKYEMTQAQWKRFTGSNPSLFTPTTRTENASFKSTHPVEQVSWRDCERELERLDLVLPTEAQWEYAARATTDTPWWTTTQGLKLDTAANLEDLAAVEAVNRPWPGIPPVSTLDDGYVWHAPVARFLPNGFGLHGMLGNVREWCRDRQGHYTQDVAEFDGERLEHRQPYRAVRGGCFLDTPTEARVSIRRFDAPDASNTFVGLRPARTVDV